MKDEEKVDLKPKKFPSRVRTPTVLQMEAVECGAAALGIVLGYYRRIVPLPELRVACGVSRDGSKAPNILKAARAYGMQAKGFKKKIERLKELSPPFIVFWNFNHFLVIEGFDRDRVYLNDPATGPRSVTEDEFDRAYTGIALVLEPGKDFKPGGRKPSLLLALIRRLQGSFNTVLYCLLAGFFLALLGIIIPAFSQIFVDNILIEQRENWLHPLLVTMGVILLLQTLLTYIQLWHLKHLKIQLSLKMSAQFLWHILRLPARFYAQRFSGEISNRLKLNDRIADVLAGELATNTINVIMVVFYAAVMLTYDWVLTLLVVFFAILNISALQWVARQRKDAYLRLAQDLGKVAGVSIAGLQSIETLKASALESDFFARWAGYYTKSINAFQNLEVSNQTLTVLPTLLTALTTMFVLVVGGLRVIEGHISIGMLVAFQLLVQSFQVPITKLVEFGGRLQELEGDITRLDDVLRNPTDEGLNEDFQPQKIDIEILNLTSPANFRYRLRGHVELQNITFGYSKTDNPLVEDFSCIVQPGQRIALVGKSGSGKSTIARVMAGLYQPWSGEIRFDGLSLAQIPRPVMTNSLAYIEQDILLFEGSIWDNLTLWDDTIAEAQLVRACQDAAIWETLRAIPGGLKGELLEGAANLSGGQRQRLEIARALVGNPSILVMDEATSALDAETEWIIDRNLRQRGCTCIIVAHRLSTIRDCDEIIVLDRGKVVQRGTHEQLREEGGVYGTLIQQGG
ncbi:NHLP family bacteriocin export ABC transporter peptidase/permease/ATPase subunit [Spirulina sp. 06S082]|uniref:NHLP family bacteriocin export ABC transporter peptidase/permease/ATPase subunit n=1 Tax=Spirulina sp. 06S082 TaxID=3110248 RepID=UPI002B20A1D3|nr:NHLP family bacteriocin export ABC transporter peptidase/permease/ATPase subunit [Spirulina sp. 06S082]MEA5468226.1 NHLP family bacteriocin export ABC transporter peptidase/permease/ATPase subunit [Spirulina sp. 06S082]